MTSSSAASSSAADPKADLVGDWKLAAIDYEGMIAVGDFNSEAFAEAGKMGVTFNADGTGAFTNGTDSATFKWDMSGTNLNVTWDDETVSSQGTKVGYDATDSIVTVSMEDSKSGTTGSVYFTKDGKYKDYESVVLSATKPITDEKTLVGTWRITGVGAEGMTMFGTADQIEKAMDTSAATMVLNADGTGSFESEGTSEACTWKVSSDGATVDLDAGGTTISCPVTAFGDEIIFDMSPVMGGTMEIFFIFGK